MIIRQITASRDWTFGKGQNNYISGEAAIEQNLLTKLLEWKGDCFFNMFTGVDWNNRLDIGQQANLLQEIKQVALSSFGIIGVSQLSGALSNRADSITMQIETIFSPSELFTLTGVDVGVSQ
ncbi:MAG: hypothetical protein KGJ13_04635 [Patescibacteria group bacterium]|nr:hypothetical protein [Patescibacteria group bacterium]